MARQDATHGRQRTGRLRIGTSGYQYRHWKERFYPTDLPQKAWFDYYAERFDTVEINNTFYNLPKVETFDHWQQSAPEGFEYALKFSRYGTHIKRLKDPEQSIPTFMDVAQWLGNHLGSILVQLPPKWQPQPQCLERFLAKAPSRIRWAFEFRDPLWLNDEVFAVLREHGAALCIHDMIEEHPRELTADWTYLRFHGEQYAGSYSSQFLTAEANRIVALLEEGHDVYAYFNNDEEAHAAHNAQALKRYINDRL
ncbi:hypothetical protein L861_22670 [Litchfieldella anticariensis FP35 = DSM 16096]|uniref:DUF72 domain-containing protein n=1 Tax=Litchfieldella anticariensis (strain DSM 16096 / CECT 5854 / CIP 108499 / LMG 22089 / FP35) TaxID=1121939 RepID=S2KLT4_LITA3|nr:DUF72 domain-containing protein [Halomonas anticariensis]EPC03117.1 hypothetical protein L861_22670 [Halomonas anticariensis FP35 = DSM 16096]